MQSSETDPSEWDLPQLQQYIQRMHHEMLYAEILTNIEKARKDFPFKANDLDDLKKNIRKDYAEADGGKETFQGQQFANSAKKELDNLPGVIKEKIKTPDVDKRFESLQETTNDKKQEATEDDIRFEDWTKEQPAKSENISMPASGERCIGYAMFIPPTAILDEDVQAEPVAVMIDSKGQKYFVTAEFLGDKIEALQTGSGVEKEQAKYLSEVLSNIHEKAANNVDLGEPIMDASKFNPKSPQETIPLENNRQSPDTEHKAPYNKALDLLR